MTRKERYLALRQHFYDMLEIYLPHPTPLLYVSLIALRTELERLYAKIQKDDGEVQTEDTVPPPPPQTLPPPPNTTG